MVSMADDFSFEQKGLHVMQAGLVFQVASLLLFMFLCAVFARSSYKRRDKLDERFVSLRASKRFRVFLWCECFYLPLGGFVLILVSLQLSLWQRFLC
jgi:RTA1 like protein